METDETCLAGRTQIFTTVEGILILMKLDHARRWTPEAFHGRSWGHSWEEAANNSSEANTHSSGESPWQNLWLTLRLTKNVVKGALLLGQMQGRRQRVAQGMSALSAASNVRTKRPSKALTKKYIVFSLTLLGYFQKRKWAANISIHMQYLNKTLWL